MLTVNLAAALRARPDRSRPWALWIAWRATRRRVLLDGWADGLDCPHLEHVAGGPIERCSACRKARRLP